MISKGYLLVCVIFFKAYSLFLHKTFAPFKDMFDKAIMTQRERRVMHYKVRALSIPSTERVYALFAEASPFSSLRRGKENTSGCLHQSADWFLLPSTAQSRQNSGPFNVKLSDAEAAEAISVEQRCLHRQPRLSVKEQPLARFLMSHISLWYLFFSLYIQWEERNKRPDS